MKIPRSVGDTKPNRAPVLSPSSPVTNMIDNRSTPCRIKVNQTSRQTVLTSRLLTFPSSHYCIKMSKLTTDIQNCQSLPDMRDTGVITCLASVEKDSLSHLPTFTVDKRQTDATFVSPAKTPPAVVASHMPTSDDPTAYIQCTAKLQRRLLAHIYAPHAAAAF